MALSNNPGIGWSMRIDREILCLPYAGFLLLRYYNYYRLNLSFVSIWVFEFCHNLSFWFLWQFEFLCFVTIWVFDVGHDLTFLSFVTIWLFELCHNLTFWVVTIWLFEFCHNLSSVTIWVLSQFEFFSFVTRGTMLCWTLKLKEVLNKQIFSASVPEAAVLIWNIHSLE